MAITPNTAARTGMFVVVAIIAMSSGAAYSQCSISGVTIQGYGIGCTPLSPIGFPPQLLAGFDSATCTLSLDVFSVPICCGYALLSRHLAIGLTQTAVPLPFLGPGCTLLAQPDLLLLIPGQFGALNILIPPFTQPGLTLFVQGATQQLTSSGAVIIELSNAVQVTTF